MKIKISEYKKNEISSSNRHKVPRWTAWGQERLVVALNGLESHDSSFLYLLT
jgi:hypothetical protein